MFDIKGFAKSRRTHENKRENVNNRLHATRALLLRASRVASVQQLHAQAAALLARHGPNEARANIDRHQVSRRTPGDLFPRPLSISLFCFSSFGNKLSAPSIVRYKYGDNSAHGFTNELLSGHRARCGMNEESPSPCGHCYPCPLQTQEASPRLSKSL